MIAADPFQWQRSGRERHAIKPDPDMPPLPGDTYQTLCKRDITLDRADFHRNPSPSSPCCDECMIAWRTWQIERAGRGRP